MFSLLSPGERERESGPGPMRHRLAEQSKEAAASKEAGSPRKKKKR